MLQIISDSPEIRRAQARLKSAFERVCDKRIPAVIGHRGYSWKTKFYWSDELKMWAVFETADGNRFWNAFGLEKPLEGRNYSPLVEINFPFKRVNRRVAGVFLRDMKGNVFIGHTGDIRGGKEGVGKTLFKKRYRGEWVSVDDGGEEREFALVGNLSSPRFPYQIREFVFEVDRIKNLAEEGLKLPTPKGQVGFSPEFQGERRFRIEKEVVSNCDHGFIVGELARMLESMGCEVGNDRLRDLYTIKSGQISAVFEIKTDLTLNSLYTGTGQLLLNSAGLPEDTELFLMLSKNPPKPIKTTLEKIGIKCLTYEMTGKGVDFQDIEYLRR